MGLTHDLLLAIATGNSRKTKKWKNISIPWSELLARLSTTVRTPETVAEYKAASRDRQAEIKDVGGFVGGYCPNGRRSDVESRSVLCLDADYADATLWDDYCNRVVRAGAIYSTHKHTPENPRLRLVIPLARDVSPDEYQAIGRKIADILGIDKFDDTTYQPERLMYWPSTSRDGEYIFYSYDAPFLNPDDVLALYRDWRDVSAWPMSSRQAGIVRRAAKKQADPLDKPGLVGAFCRAYSIRDAIAAFVPEYEPCDVPDRYTYTGGSTAAGVIIYDDKFSFSHHATDPASGQLCNAWDLVRIHKYGPLDDDTDPDTPANQRPSYRAMCDYASDDSRVKAQILEDRRAEADVFDTLDSPGQSRTGSDSSTASNWTDKLKMTDKGVLVQSIENAVTVLSNDPDLVGCIALNELQNNIVAVKRLPWRDVGKESPWVDADDAQLRLYLEQRYGLTSKDRIFDAVNVVAQVNRFHPIRDYLAGCSWDGVPRVDTLLVDYLGADDTEYTRAVTRKTLVAAVARIYNPGCKFDYMLTLQGRQGLGKSAIIAKLGGPWYSDTLTTVTGKEAYEQLVGVWIMEVGELAGMRIAESNAVKQFISKASDRYRPAYGRRIQDFPRQCIFIGTTNEMQFLRDSTGNRRFWVVATPNDPARDMWTDLDAETVKQVWAEARHYYQAGETLYLSRELEEQAQQVQEGFEEEDPHVGLVAEFLDRLLPTDWEERDLFDRRQWLESGAVGTVQRETVCTAEIWAEALDGDPRKFDRYAGMKVRAIMGKLPGWRACGNLKITVKPYGRQRYFKRKGIL